MTRIPANSILNQLPAAQRNSLLARLEPVSLPVGEMLMRPGEIPAFAHFMTSGIASVVTYMKNGGAVEVGLISSEGIVEAMHLLGSASSPTTVFMQVTGTALRMPFQEFVRETFESEQLLRLVLDFVQRHNFALTQLAACNGLHEIEERLARWLLMVQDRLRSSRFELTQEFLAGMLGTRRTSVTLAASSLQQSGWIEYRRGHIRILDREGLRSAACECYPVVRKLIDDHS